MAEPALSDLLLGRPLGLNPLVDTLPPPEGVRSRPYGKCSVQEIAPRAPLGQSNLLARLLGGDSDRTLEDTQRDMIRFGRNDPTMTDQERSDMVSNFIWPSSIRRIADPIRVYHGSPHRFDEFRMDRIGTG